MALNFVLGKNQFDHHQKMMELFRKEYQKNPNDQFFFLVPNHIKFESEINMLKELGEDQDELIATSNVQSFSFSRLAWYFLRSNSTFTAESLTETKSAMILRDIINKNKKSLQIFSGMTEKSGFFEQLSKQFNEFQNGQIQPDDIEESLKTGDEVFFKDKVAELNLIYRDYLDATKNYQTNDYQLNALANYLNQDLKSKNYHFYIESFSSFTAAELNLVSSLIINGASFNISLIMEKPVLGELDSASFYYRPENTYQQLYKLARNNQIAVYNVFANEVRINKDIRSLEDYWIQSSSLGPVNGDTKLKSPNSVQIWKCTNKQTEVSAISTYIRQLVATQNNRYKDFLIVARDLGQYRSFIESFMEVNDVPYFIDLEKKMTDHPFKKMIDLLFKILNRGMQSSDVISLLRTELMLPVEFESTAKFRDAVDLTENYVLATGITKRNWLGDDFKPDADLDKDIDTSVIEKYHLINIVKNFVKNLFTKLDEFFKTDHSSVDAATFLYNFLDEQGVFKQLLLWQKQATEKNDLSLANQPEQVVNKFNEILDEYVSVFNDAKFDAKNFIEILDAAFETAQYSQIPSTLDAVNISEIGMVQPNNRKITLILGATTDNMPAASVSNNIITNDERKLISDSLGDDKFLKDSDEVVNNSEPFLHDLVFTTPSSRLIFTYPGFTDDNKQKDLSSYVVRIKNHFQLEEQDILFNPDANESEDQVIRYVGSKSSSLNYLIRVSRLALDNKDDISNSWKYVRNQLYNEEPDKTEFVLDSLNYKNLPHDLNPKTVAKLYGENVNVSISRLETFYKNEYEYFLKYGLRLQPRQIFEVTPAQTGSLFHAVLDGLVKRLNNDSTNLKYLSDSQIQQLVHQIFSDQIVYPENRIFRINDRMDFISTKLEATVLQLIMSMKEQLTHNEFVPRASEVTFGRIKNQQNLPGLSFDLSNDHKINVRGKIDRIDELTIDDVNYLAVIDYKSSKHDFSFADFLAGLSMQMPTYLQSLVANLDFLSEGNNTQIAGAFYSHIQNPKVTLNNKIKPDLELLKKFKLSGLIVDDKELLDNLDTRLISGISTVLPMRKKKDGTIKVNESSLITKDDLFRILSYNKHLITQAGDDIYSGRLRLNPYRDRNLNTGLQYSDYKSIFEFDAMLPENDYHEIINYNKKDVLEKIQSILEDGE
ncbi:PD-(D/E)XK nuclease family protein [Companilactobacillus baiquanensis]|uniref:PD-(D/E)XK nuclease family protein n=1 Tax=Companilactobacillus baiquanensis TaxID=2486005 RepID=A0ABW1UXQ3_9LACO|nr:PD-(D/E)XK nuclease family protein [Companilactobacillus baiquanensis]